MGNIAQGMSLHASYAIDALNAARESPDASTRLLALNQATSHANRCLRAEVEALRADGVTWQQIGDYLSVTRQAAQRRFTH